VDQNARENSPLDFEEVSVSLKRRLEFQRSKWFIHAQEIVQDIF
jgi:hypothetical protein